MKTMIVPSPKSTEEAQQLIADAIHGLQPTGESGFEEFMESLLSEFTGHAFYVAKSGHQHGTDVRSSPQNFVKVGLEAKHYRSGSKPSLDQLLHKITDASTASKPVDLWLLAATWPVDVSDREKLHAHAESCGIAVLVFDWPRRLTQLCEFAVLCASAPETCKSFLKNTLSLGSAFAAVRQSPNFEQTSAQLLERLTHPSLGYDSARRGCGQWLKTAQSSLANAKSRLGGHHNLFASDHGVVQRANTNAQLDKWYAGPDAVAALLGDEGMGKTWAALDWHRRLGSFDDNSPLTVFLSAKAIDGTDVKSTLANALATQTKSQSPVFWKKRLDLWERNASPGVRILVLLDGLNENFAFTDWAEWLQPLFEDRLSGMYRVIVSCWPNWWERSLFCLANLTPKAVEVKVGAFDDDELSELLQAMRVEQSDFAPAVLELMRVPRLSSLVAEHRDKLEDSGDVTAERVIYEDWKDRIERRGPRTGLSHNHMQSFVADIGNKMKADLDQNLTKTDVINSLSDASGKTGLELEPAIGELGSGGWLKPGARPNTYRVASQRIPFVLGATLVSQIANDTLASSIEQDIAEFLDPLKAHRLGAAILRAATTIALITSGTSLILRQTLLYRWLDESNFAVEDFEAFWRLAGLDPDLFLDLAETRWLARTNSYFRDEVLIKSLANAAEFNTFRPALMDRLTRWLGTVWTSLYTGPADQTTDPKQVRLIQPSAATRSRYKAWESGSAAASFTTIRLDENDGWSWLSARAIPILSYMNRKPFVSALEAWALSRAIMNDSRHSDQVAWLLRLNASDSVSTVRAIDKLIARLHGQHNPFCDEAAGYLRAAVSHTEKAGAPTERPLSPDQQIQSFDVPLMDSEALNRAATRYLKGSAWKTYDPDSSTALINELVRRGLDADTTALNLLVDNLADVLTLLTPDNRRRLRDAIATAQESITPTDQPGKPLAAKLLSAQFTLELYDADPKRQAILILSSGIGAARADWSPLSRPVTVQDIEGIDPSHAAPHHLAGWLEYLFDNLAETEAAELDFLPNLVTHFDKKVRQTALQLAATGPHFGALEAFANSRYASMPNDKAEPAREYEYWRNRALLEFCQYSPTATISKCLAPEHIALVAENSNADAQALDKFNVYLQAEFEALRIEKSWSSGRYWASHENAIGALVEHDLDALLAWLGPWLQSPHALRGNALMTEFPAIDTMHALASTAPELSLALYEALLNASNKGFFSSEGIETFPFEINTTRATQLCDSLLARGSTDKDLLVIVYAAHRHDRLDWLFRHISRLYDSTFPADVAKALTLLGMCDQSDRARSEWDALGSQPPADEWLQTVFSASLDDYASNQTARSALTDFWSSQAPSDMRHAVRRFLEACDTRCTLWINDLLPIPDDRDYIHTTSLRLAVHSLNQRCKRDKDARKKTLFHTPLGLAYSTMAPWK